MSLAENLLNSLDENAYQNMRIAGSGQEEHIKVGQDRVITVPNSLKTIAVKGDKDIETITVDCVRYWDGHDLSTFAIYLNYILPNGDEGTYIPESITKSEDIFSFDWEIGSEFTYAQGKLTFWIVTKLTDEVGTLKKQWSSFQNSDCNIAQGGDKIYVPEKQEDQDVISQAISVSRASAEFAEEQANLAQGAASRAASDATEAAEGEVTRLVGELGVVQGLGNSPTSTVSQLTTTALYNRTSKRLSNIEKSTINSQFVTDSTVAYIKAVPSNSLSYALLQKIGGMSYAGDFSGLRTAAVTEVVSTGANVSDISTPESGYFYDSDGTPSSANDKYICFYVLSVEPNTTYTLSSNLNFFTIWFDDGVNAFSRTKFGVTNKGTLTTPANTKRLRISLYNTSGAADTTAFEWFMINKGSTALPYQPYKVLANLPIPTEVQSLDGYGLGVNANHYNHISWDEDGRAYWNVMVKRKIFDGTETFSFGESGEFRCGGITAISNSNTVNCICNHYAAETRSGMINTANIDKLSASASHIRWRDSTATTVDEMKAKLKAWYDDGDPLTVDYIIATPVVTDISDLITPDNIIEVTGNGVIEFKNQYNLAPASTVTYRTK